MGPWIALAFMLLSSISSGATYDKELQTIKREFESQASSTIRSVIGNDKFLVVAQLKRKLPGSSAEKNPSRAPDDLASISNLGYASAAIPPMDGSNELEFSSVTLDVKLPVNVGAQAIQFLKGALLSQFSEYNVRLNFGSIPNSPIQAQAEQNSPPPAPRLEEKPEPRSALAPWMHLYFIVLGLIIMLWGMSAFVMRGFTAIAKQVSESVRSLGAKPVAAPKTTPPVDTVHRLETGSPLAKELPENKVMSSSESFRKKNHSRNLQFLKNTLLKNPQTLLQVIKPTPTDVYGLIATFPLLDESEQTRLQEILNSDWKSLISGPQNPVKDFDADAWLQGIVENMALAKLSGNRGLQKCIGNDVLIELMQADSSAIAHAAIAENYPAAWRIVTELLPSQIIKDIILNHGVSVINALVKSSEAKESELAQAAQRLIARVRQIPIQRQEEKARRNYFKSALLPPVIEVLAESNSEKDRELLEHLKEKYPEFYSLLMEKHWIPDSLSQVPIDFLRDHFSAFPVEDRANILFALPEQWRAILFDLCPPGMAKTIVADLVARKIDRNSEVEKSDAKSSLQHFLEDLQSRAENGEFALVANRSEPSEKKAAA